jgi:hypothetical protein
VHDLKSRLQEERAEKASLLDEKRTLAARLAKLKEASNEELREKAELQEALIRWVGLRHRGARVATFMCWCVCNEGRGGEWKQLDAGPA